MPFSGQKPPPKPIKCVRKVRIWKSMMKNRRWRWRLHHTSAWMTFCHRPSRDPTASVESFVSDSSSCILVGWVGLWALIYCWQNLDKYRGQNVRDTEGHVFLVCNLLVGGCFPLKDKKKLFLHFFSIWCKWVKSLDILFQISCFSKIRENGLPEHSKYFLPLVKACQSLIWCCKNVSKLQLL